MSDTLAPQNMEDVLANAPVGIMLLDGNNKVSWANDTLMAMVNASREQLLGKSAEELQELQLQLLFSEQSSIYIPPLHGEGERWLERKNSTNSQGGVTHYYLDVTREHHLERERNRLESIVLESATSDTITGLLNRRGVVQRLEPQIARCRRYETPLSIIMFSAKVKKTDNSHISLGEQALLELAQLVKDYVRWADMVGHDGDGEFLMVLPETSLEGAAELAGRLAKVIEETRLSGLEEGVELRVAVGLSEWRKNDSVNVLMQRVDEALSEADPAGEQVKVA
ncbi:MAG: diguanylate cyclase [Gammaproteobacteria bacterium]|nr:diguanylate cyclase [Gammaproteobacteria bacterium]